MKVKRYRTKKAWTADRLCECGGTRTVVTCPLKIAGREARVVGCSRRVPHHHARCVECRKEWLIPNT